MGRIVNAGEAARIVGVSERTMRQWLTDGKIHGAEKVQRLGKPATWEIDTDALPEREADAPASDAAGHIAELERQISELRRQVSTLAGLRSSPYPPPSLTMPTRTHAPASNNDDTADDAMPEPPMRRRIAHTRPLAQSAHTRGMRTHRLYTAFWRTDVEQAHNGLMAFQTFAKLCGIQDSTRDAHQRREAAGELPRHLGLSFTRVSHGTTELRYVDASQRAQWAAYWISLSYLDAPPDEASIAHDLDELMTWGA